MKKKHLDLKGLSTLIRESKFKGVSKGDCETQSLSQLGKLAYPCDEIDDLINKGYSDKLILLSEVVGKNRDLFSTKEERDFPSAKDLDKEGDIITIYKCLQTFLAPWGILFKNDPQSQDTLYTRIYEVVNVSDNSFFSPECPVTKCEIASYQKKGFLKDRIRDLIDSGKEISVDYLFSSVTGHYLAPVFVSTLKQKRRLLATNKSLTEDESLIDAVQEEVKGDKTKKIKKRELPYIVFFGCKSYDPCFGFGLPFTKNIIEIIESGASEYKSVFRSFYSDLARETEKTAYNVREEDGTVYSTVKLKERMDKKEIPSAIFFPPKSFVPDMIHFADTKRSISANNKTLKEIKMEDVVRLFPSEEIKILKLTIGRALIGASMSSEYMDNSFSLHHDWRKMLVIVGEPGIGKSTILDRVREAMIFCGFDVVSAKDINTKFNKRGTYRADLSCYDDLNEERLKAILTSQDFKSCITGGTIPTEEKMEQAVETTPKAVFIGNINDYTPTSLYSVDNGAKNRFTVISAYAATGGVMQNPYHLTRTIARELGVEEIAIWIRILRDCLDFTLPYCAIGNNAPTNKENMSIDNVIRKISLNSTLYFDSQPGITFLILLLTAHGVAYANPQNTLSMAKQDIRDTTVFFEGVRSLYYFLTLKNKEEVGKEFISLIYQNWNESRQDEQFHPRMGMKELRAKSLTKPFSILSSHMADKSFDPENISQEAITEVIIECQNQNGFIRKAYSTIASDWNTIGSNPRYLGIIKEVSTFILANQKSKPEYTSSGILST